MFGSMPIEVPMAGRSHPRGVEASSMMRSRSILPMRRSRVPSWPGGVSAERLRPWTAYSGCGMTSRCHGSAQVCTGHPELFSSIIRGSHAAVRHGTGYRRFPIGSWRMYRSLYCSSAGQSTQTVNSSKKILMSYLPRMQKGNLDSIFPDEQRAARAATIAPQ